MAEATFVCIDNSDFSRNQDLSSSTRLDSQRDAANLISIIKAQNNPENSIALLTLAGKVPRILVTLAEDTRAFLNRSHSISANGNINVISGIQIAHLCLKNRLNKTQRQKIILFICSPIDTPISLLRTIGRKLRKANVAVDLINIGNEENKEKLAAFIESSNKNENSTLINIQSGSDLRNAVINSLNHRNIQISEFAASATESSNRFAHDDDDPELELALRISLDEERNRYEKNYT